MGQPKPGRPIINRDQALKRAYWIWNAMIRRCHDPRAKQFYDYGGRGISVCDEWRSDFWSFYDDMYPRPDDAMLDRRNNDAGYSKANCRWVSQQQSNANRRYCILVAGKTLKEFMRDTGQLERYGMVAKRIKKGMPIEQAINQPSRQWP